LLGVTSDCAINDARADAFLASLAEGNALVLPVWCGSLEKGKMRVVFGEPASPRATVAELRREIEKLKEWIHANDGNVAAGH
jgi:hypothetical protein